jgi:PAS domain S-box-containing protein
MVGVAVDITGQLEAEREAVQARNYLNAVTDQIVEGIYVVDDENGLTYMNAAAQELLGYTPEALAGRNLHEVVHYMHPDGTPYPVEECPITAVREGRIASHVESEDALIRADGSFVPVSYSASSFETPEGMRGVSVVFRDITKEKAERDRVREELEAMSWVGPIREALRNDAMLLHGQPIVDIATGEVVQQELLVRLPGEDGEAIAAGRFLPAAEQYEMIGEIDRWVIANAIAVAATLGESVQFNLSAASIQDPSTPAMIEEELARAGVPPERLVIEVTESSLIRDFVVAERFANRLVADGCALALDDFGTGYGGFTYLTRLNVSILKIDQSFVANMLTDASSRTVVKAVAGLATEFGLTTVAEGVENAETLEMLADFGVQQAQGYYLGRPGELTGLPPEHKFRSSLRPRDQP